MSVPVYTEMKRFDALLVLILNNLIKTSDLRPALLHNKIHYNSPDVLEITSGGSKELFSFSAAQPSPAQPSSRQTRKGDFRPAKIGFQLIISRRN